MASDLGKIFGWCSGVFLHHFPVWVVLFFSAFMGLCGYGLQWLLIQRFISLPYFLVFLLCLPSGCSITWFNTVCQVLCINNFPATKSLALSLSISFNGISAAVYNIIANAINPGDSSLYLLLNGLVPFITSVIALTPILSEPPTVGNSVHNDNQTFLCLYIMAAFFGLHLSVLNSTLSHVSLASVIVFGLIFLLILTLVIFGCLDYWRRKRKPSNNDAVELETQNSLNGTAATTTEKSQPTGCCEAFFMRDCLTRLGEEHSVRMLICRWDFGLYFVTYICGGTIGLVYSNSLGQIAQSLGHSSDISTFFTIYSASSFFGRLLAAVPDFLQHKVNCARTGWLTLALIPTPVAFLLLVSSGSKMVLKEVTTLIGLSSGFVFSAAASITSELFGQKRAGINHNILITNIPLGSFLYGRLAAALYEASIDNSNDLILADGSKVCIGKKMLSAYIYLVELHFFTRCCFQLDAFPQN